MDGVRLEKTELAEAAIDAASMILRDILIYPPKRGQMQITPIQFTRDDITVVSRVSGDMSAELFLGLSYGTAKAVLDTMLRQAVDSLGQLEKSALAELGGMIADTTLAILEDRGALCYATWSSVVVGREERVTPFSVPTLAAPLSLAVGDINLNVMFEGYAPFSWASPDARLASQTRLRLSRTRSSQQDAHVRLAA